MLAFLGVLVQEFVHLPSPQFANPVATEAFFSVPAGGLWQVFLACGLVEFISHRGKLSYNDMFDGGREPGNFGFECVGAFILRARIVCCVLDGAPSALWCTTLCLCLPFRRSTYMHTNVDDISDWLFFFLVSIFPSLSRSPMGMYKGTPAQKKKLELNEIKNGRLAMLGIGGVIHSNFIYHQPIVSQLLGGFHVPITQALN